MKTHSIANSVTKAILGASALLAVSSTTMAQDLEITVTNLTKALYFTPIITAAHTPETNIFSVATAASPELQAMAEGGDISGLESILTNASANMIANPEGGLLAPAMSTTYDLTNTETNTHLSLGAMILPSNDGFVGVDSWMIPTEAGTYTMYLNAYDAGTEANNELVVEGGGAPGVAGIPAEPGGNAGMNGTGIATTESNTMVHIHSGTIGDDMSEGGKSDLDNRIHRWLNPVAKLTVIVK